MNVCYYSVDDIVVYGVILISVYYIILNINEQSFIVMIRSVWAYPLVLFTNLLIVRWVYVYMYVVYIFNWIFTHFCSAVNWATPTLEDTFWLYTPVPLINYLSKQPLCVAEFRTLFLEVEEDVEAKVQIKRVLIA